MYFSPGVSAAKHPTSPVETAKDKGLPGEVSSLTKKKGKIVAITAEDMQKKKNDVKPITTLLLALPDEHQLRFSKYHYAKELWEAILKTFGGNKATKKIKKNQLKQQYGNFKAEGSETLEQKFNRLQAIVSHMSSWMYTIVWRNRDDLDTMSLDDVYNHLKVYKPEVQKRAGSNSQNMTFISSSNNNNGKSEVPTLQGASTATTQPNGSQIKYENISQIDDDDIEEMDIKWNLALLSMRANRFWTKIGKKITIQGSGVAGFNKSKVKCFNCHKMGHFARECRSPKRGKRESYKKDPKVKEPAPKAMIAIDGIGWDWSYMVKEDEASKNHALMANKKKVPIEYALMAKSSSSSDNEIYDDSFCSKSCRKNTKNLNTKISKLNKELSDCETDLYNYKRGLSQVEARLVEFKENEIKYCEKIRVLEKDIELKDNKIKYLRNELEEIGLPEFVDDTVTDYTRPIPSIYISKSISIPQDNIDDKEYWDSGCSRHMTGNISYLSEYEPFNGGYVSFGHGRGKIIRKGLIKTDIMFAVCACARHQVTTKECHLHAVKRIFRYLKGNPKLGLWYPKESPFNLVAYSDSDYGANQDKKSTIRGCQLLERRLISWQCKKKTIVATSTTKAEYVAAASGCRQVLWIQNHLLDYGVVTQGTLQMGKTWI
uniref:CCHC-type domain-containing protein n=1 Tax=Tanacetum cinerariifolium TaxID=118510 RepID=A0A6L2NXD3_TANCI|nr:hypothetical protein [Tanacetum cinerariifolium]